MTDVFGSTCRKGIMLRQLYVDVLDFTLLIYKLYTTYLLHLRQFVSFRFQLKCSENVSRLKKILDSFGKEDMMAIKQVEAINDLGVYYVENIESFSRRQQVRIPLYEMLFFFDFSIMIF